MSISKISQKPLFVKNEQTVKQCEECGKRFWSDKSGRRYCYGCRSKSLYKHVDIDFIDGVPRCPICGSLCVKESGKWHCHTEDCPLIYFERRGKSKETRRYRLYMDSIMASHGSKAQDTGASTSTALSLVPMTIKREVTA